MWAYLLRRVLHRTCAESCWVRTSFSIRVRLTLAQVHLTYSRTSRTSSWFISPWKISRVFCSSHGHCSGRAQCQMTCSWVSKFYDCWWKSRLCYMKFVKLLVLIVLFWRRPCELDVWVSEKSNWRRFRDGKVYCGAQSKKLSRVQYAMPAIKRLQFYDLHIIDMQAECVLLLFMIQNSTT